jgi:hypothetical protein
MVLDLENCQFELNFASQFIGKIVDCEIAL